MDKVPHMNKLEVAVITERPVGEMSFSQTSHAGLVE